MKSGYPSLDKLKIPISKLDGGATVVKEPSLMLSLAAKRIPKDVIKGLVKTYKKEWDCYYYFGWDVSARLMPYANTEERKRIDKFKQLFKK